MKKYKQNQNNDRTKFHIVKGDMVHVLSGNYRGQKGKVLSVVINNNRAFVEGINIVTKHTKPTNANPKGGIIKKEASIHISKLMVIDPKSGEPSRIGRKIDEKGKRVRYAKKSGTIITK